MLCRYIVVVVKVGLGHRIFSSFTEYLPVYTSTYYVCANLVCSIREGTYVFLCVSVIRALIKGLCENMRSYVKVDYYGTRFVKIKLLLLLLKVFTKHWIPKRKKVETCFPSFFPISLLHVNSKHKTRILLIYSSSRRFSNP